MKIITAIEPIIEGSPSVFLGGGITNCPPWQDFVLNALQPTHGVIYNPRRADFPINDPNAAAGQIEWEFRALEQADIFSMWFCNSASDQPICMYELGRHLAIRELRGELDLVAIGVEPGYRRAYDVQKQVECVSPELAMRISTTLDAHVTRIQEAVARVAGLAAQRADVRSG